MTAAKSKAAPTFKPNAKAAEKVTGGLPAPTVCHYDGGKVSTVHHRTIYGKAYGKWPWVYRCEKCGARVGMHPNTAIPLGTLADDATREARKTCKPAFEALWNTATPHMSRDEAYSWLASALAIEPRVCHFAMFDVATCQRAQQVSVAYRKSL